MRTVRMKLKVMIQYLRVDVGAKKTPSQKIIIKLTGQLIVYKKMPQLMSRYPKQIRIN